MVDYAFVAIKDRDIASIVVVHPEIFYFLCLSPHIAKAIIGSLFLLLQHKFLMHLPQLLIFLSLLDHLLQHLIVCRSFPIARVNRAYKHLVFVLGMYFYSIWSF